MLQSMHSSFDILWRQLDEADAARMMLARFESPAFIHITTHAEHEQKKTQQPASSPDAVILYNLPRYRLTFELRPGESQLRCSNYAGYQLPVKQDTSVNPRLPLSRFHNFLLLQSLEETMPLKLLVPDGTLKREPCTAVCSLATSQQVEVDNLGHHAFSFNKRTLSFDATVVHSRLYLAAVYAATHCEVPVPGLGMTGGEHAIELLRQSWVNRPLLQGEASALAAVVSFSGHTPALQLLCQGLFEDSESFAFLHGRAPARCSAAARSQHAAHDAYAQDAQRTAPLPFMHARRQLLREEEQSVLSQVPCSIRNGSVRVARTVQWDDLRAAGLKLDASLANDVQNHVFHRQVLELQEKYCTPMASISTEGPNISMSHLTGDAFGAEVAGDLEDSMRFLQESPPDMHVERHRLPSLAKELRALQCLVCNAEHRLAAFLLKVLAFTPASEVGTAMSAFQAAALMAVPAQADLLRVTVFPETLQVLMCPSVSCTCSLILSGSIQRPSGNGTVYSGMP